MTEKKRKPKRAKGSSKGSRFERSFCVELSRWWTNGKRDDIFWRASGSGGRATRRGKRTAGSHGDVSAIDPSGEELLDLCVIELKKGYDNSSPITLLDKADYHAEQTFERFIRQARDACRLAGSYSWVLVHGRNRRETIIYLPIELWNLLKRPYIHPQMRLYVECCGTPLTIVGVQLRHFLEKVKPEQIRKLRGKV